MKCGFLVRLKFDARLYNFLLSRRTRPKKRIEAYSTGSATTHFRLTCELSNCVTHISRLAAYSTYHCAEAVTIYSVTYLHCQEALNASAFFVNKFNIYCFGPKRYYWNMLLSRYCVVNIRRSVTQYWPA